VLPKKYAPISGATSNSTPPPQEKTTWAPPRRRLLVKLLVVLIAFLSFVFFTWLLLQARPTLCWHVLSLALLARPFGFLRFLPRDAMRKRGICRRQVSVCHVDGLNPDGYRISSNFFLGPRYPTILFFLPQHRYPIPRGSRGAKYMGWENCAIFDWNRRLSRKRYEIGPWLLWNVNRKSYAFYRMVCIFNHIDGPLTQFSRSRHFYKSNISKKCLRDKVTIEG